MLRKEKTQEPQRLICDFIGGAVGHRFRFGGGRGQALPKAVGMKGGKTPIVVDATAGLGRDAFLLASLGAKVTLIERSPDMHRLLEEGLACAREAGGDVAEAINRMTLLHGDARDLLPTLAPEVVLVDPMHPPRKKTALAKNEMRLIRAIVGTDEDSVELMKLALATASRRVVLKWPLRADPMDGIRPPSHQIVGKSTRHDVFMVGRQIGTNSFPTEGNNKIYPVGQRPRWVRSGPLAALLRTSVNSQKPTFGFSLQNLDESRAVGPCDQ